MDFSPEEFEQQIYRIHTLIENTGAQAEIKWRDHVPDFADGRSREVDISIRKDGRFTFVECRHRSRPQDKLWIEQLAGKRQLLNADAVIAVSSSGFSKGAIAAAKYLGVHYRQLTDISLEEAGSWPNLSTVFLSFVQFQRLLFKVRINGPYHSKEEKILQSRDGALVSFFDLAIQLTDKLFEELQKTNDNRTWRQFHASNFGKDKFSLDGVPVVAMAFECNARHLRTPQILSTVYDYSATSLSSQPIAIVEKTENQISEIIKVENHVNWYVDLSQAVVPENSVFMAVTSDHGKPVVMSQAQLRFGNTFVRSRLTQIDVEVHSD